MDFFEVLKKRHSIREFQEKKIPEKTVQELLAAINSAPSAGNLQAFEVVLVSLKEKKKKLAQAALNQSFIAQAPLVLVFLANPEKSATKYGQRGANLYCLLDAAIAAAYAQLSAAALDLGTVWIGAFDDKNVKEVLKAPEELIPVAILPLGFPAETPSPTPRRKPEELVKKEEF